MARVKTTVRVSCYLTVVKHTKGYGFKVNKEKPPTPKNGVTLSLHLGIPEELFSEPTYKINIEVPHEHRDTEADVSEIKGAIEGLGIIVREITT